MRIQAFLPCFNEADILPHALHHMCDQDIEVQVLDGWSDDGSYEIAQECAGVTVERFPAEGKSPEWACRPTLSRIEVLAAQSPADWCGLSDADEFRFSCYEGESLAAGIARIDAAGYNAIDHTVFSFACTDDTWNPCIDPVGHFRWYDPADMIATLPQVKWWKNTGKRVNLKGTGGHAALFPCQRVAPEKWIMKHYPYRTPDQARSKVLTRLARRCHEEHRDGWGVHYDAFPADFSFCWDKAKLKEWK